MILFLYGASGAAIEVYDLAKRINRYSKIVLIDDYKEECKYYDTDRIHFDSSERYAAGEQFEFAVAVGEPSSRKLLYDRIISKGYKLATLIDKTAIICDSAIIRQGCVINAGTIVSSNVTLEENCMILYHAVIGHDAHVKKHTVICPKATVGGGSTVGEKCFLGLNSSMMQGVNIGDEAIVGMGTMAFRDVRSGATVIGNPARETKGNMEHKVFA